MVVEVMLCDEFIAILGKKVEGKERMQNCFCLLGASEEMGNCGCKKVKESPPALGRLE